MSDADDDRLHDETHREVLERTGFWGARGAGCIVMARDTGRILLPLRSEEVLEGGTWGTWGGAVDPGLDIREALLRELAQETGFSGDTELRELYLFVAPGGGFSYQNYLVLVESEFDPVLNWETERALWVEADALPDPLHFGLAALMADEASREAIMDEAARRRPSPGTR